MREERTPNRKASARVSGSRACETQPAPKGILLCGAADKVLDLGLRQADHGIGIDLHTGKKCPPTPLTLSIDEWPKHSTTL
jgi:hypothetical protein